MKQPPRRRARILAFQTLHSRQLLGINQIGETLLAKEFKLKEELQQFAQGLIQYSWENLDTLDPSIQKHLTGWKQERLSQGLLTLLRLATSEITTKPKTDLKIIFNEYIEICKSTIGPEASSLFNGTLNQIAAEIRPAS